MHPLRRILKYTPALVLGLLVVAWVVSGFRGIGYRNKSRTWEAGVNFSTVVVNVSNSSITIGPTGWFALPSRFHLNRFIGRYQSLFRQHGEIWFRSSHIPIPLLSTALFPLAIGPFVSFRFRLWHYLAYTALVAAELAYYLRWQG